MWHPSTRQNNNSKALLSLKVIHLAAVSDEADFLTMLLDANVKALYNVCHTARGLGARVILASSTRAISGLLGSGKAPDASGRVEPVKLEDGVAPLDHYGLSRRGSCCHFGRSR